MGKKLLNILLIIFLSSGLPLFLSASEITGSIKGKVTDTEGYPLPGAFIYVDSPVLQDIQTYITKDTGKIKFQNLPPGKYKITVEMPGFKTVHIENIIVCVGMTLNLPIKMEMTTIEEETTVKIPSPAVDTESTKTAVIREEDLLVHIPYERDISRLINSAPGIIQDFDLNRLTFINQGSTARANIYAFDGVNMNDPVGMHLLTDINYDVIEEVEIETAGHPAETSSLDGGYINIITKSGKNGFTGGITFYHSSDKFIDNLRSEEEIRKMEVSWPPGDRKLWDISLSLGGSILEDKLWYFGNARLISQSQTTSFIPWTDPQGKEHKEYNWDNKEKMGFFKLSGRFSPPLKLTAMFNFIDRYRPRDNFSLDWNLTGEATRILDHEKSFLGSAILNYSLSQNTFMDLKGGYVNYKVPLYLQEAVKLNPQYYDESTGHLWGSGRFNESQLRKRFQASGVLSHFQDNLFGIDHEFKVGGEYEYTYGEWDGWKEDNLLVHYNNQDNNQDSYFYGLALSPSTGNTVGKGKISFTLASKIEGGFRPRNELRRLGFFLQDSATILERLTLNLGLRFDRLYASQLNYIKTESGNPVALQLGEDLIKPVIGLNPFAQNYVPDWKNMMILNSLSYRLGLSLDIFDNGKGVFKASFSRYPEYPTLQTLFALNTFSIDRSHSFYWFDENKNGQVDLDDTYTLFPEDYRLYLEEYYKKRISPDIHLPFTNEITIGIQQELFNDFSLRVNYVHKEKKDIFENVLYNADLHKDWYSISQDTENWWIPFRTIIPGVDDFPEKEVTLYFWSAETALALFDRLKNVPELTQKYQAIEFSFKKRMSHNWQLSGSAVFSRTTGNIDLDFASSSGFSVAADSPNYFINFPPDSRLNLDRPLVIKLMGTYRFPWDFYLSFYFSQMSGTPWTRSVTVIPPQSWIEKEKAYGAYVNVLLETPGTLRNDSYENLDIRIEKEFLLSTSRKLKFFVDIFNVLGNKYRNIIQNDGGYWFPAGENTAKGIRVLSPNYQKVTSLFRGRVFKLGLHLRF